MNRTIRFTLFFSLLLHLAFFWETLLHAFFPATPKPEQLATQQTIELQLEQAPPKLAPKPKANPETQKASNKPPPSKHMEDDINKANTSDGEAEADSGQKHKQKAHQQGQQNNQEINEQSALSPQSMQQKKLKALQKIFGKKLQNTTLQDSKATHLAKEDALDDDSLADSNIEDSRSKQQEAKARWYNQVLKRISEQVNYVWVKPDGVDQSTWGTIKLDIDAQGYLLSAWVHLPSGNQALDRSALNAIRSVIRYQIPESANLSRYYRHLTFNYHGGDDDKQQ